MEADSSIEAAEKESEISVFKLQEHDFLKEKYPKFSAYFDSLNEIGVEFSETEYEGVPDYLGITPDFRANYYIGATWLCPKNKTVFREHKAVVVLPKMENIDFIKMFLTALQNHLSSEYFSKFYRIDFSQPSIKTDALDNILSPLLLLHYIAVLEQLVKRGLKKDYVFREENLSSKIRGKILIQRNLRTNIFKKRADKIFCRFQESTADTKENRLLKKALNFSKKMFQTLDFGNTEVRSELYKKISKVSAAFDSVSDNIETHEVQSIKTNKCYREYSTAIKIAKMILRRYDYSIENAGVKNKSVPPFWIDMSRLYEVYVYALLEKAYPNQIAFQVKGHCKTAVDFIKCDEKLIMDTKYKPHYKDSNSGIIDDIREIAGYARDKKILKELKVSAESTEEIKCLIIYPKPVKLLSDEDDEEDTDCKSISDLSSISSKTLLKFASPISWFRNFFKISVELPVIE